MLVWERPDRDQYYLEIARVVSNRSTCLRRHYGAVIVNHDEIISTGYNGNVRCAPNCYGEISKCPRENAEHNDGMYIGCEAVHAEMNSMLSPARIEMLGATMYLAGFDVEYSKANSRFELHEIEEAFPCPICLRMMKNAGLSRLVTKAKTYNLEGRKDDVDISARI